MEVFSLEAEREFKPEKHPKYSATTGYWGGPTERRQSILYGPTGQLVLESELVANDSPPLGAGPRSQ